MKRKTAREILAESFRELTGRKPVGRITVIDITENCGYSTTTFYRHFRDKYDLMAWEHTRKIENIMSAFDADECGWKQTCLDAALFFHEERDYLKNLLQYTSGYDSFVHNMKQIHFESLRKKIQDVSGISDLDEETEMYILMYSHGSIDLTCNWITGRYDLSPDKMAEVYENCMPLPLRQYLK